MKLPKIALFALCEVIALVGVIGFCHAGGACQRGTVASVSVPSFSVASDWTIVNGDGKLDAAETAIAYTALFGEEPDDGADAADAAEEDR